MQRPWEGQPTINTLRPRQNGCHFADATFNRIFVNENVLILIKFSLKFVPKGPINNIPALVQMMACRRSGDKPLSETVVVSLLTHICVTQPQWINKYTDRLWFSRPLLNVVYFIACRQTGNNLLSEAITVNRRPVVWWLWTCMSPQMYID